MFQSAIVFAILAFSDAITDTNCTAAGAYTNQATICSNAFSDSACEAVYTTPVVAGSSDERPAACFNGTNGPDEDVKSMAVANCPKTCGYCCESSEYDCDDAQFPRIQCSTITSRMCLDALWRTIIAEDCPSACGFCNEGGCVDAAPDCSKNPSICVTIGLESFVATNCQRTCGLCSSSSTTAATAVTTAAASGGSSGCSDTSSNCAAWAAKGFCTNTFYTSTSKAQYCAATCGLCGKK